MSDPGHEPPVNRVRVVAAGLVRQVGGLAAVRTLLTVLAVYDGAGGGLVAGGLAYASLLALLPGLLLALSIIGLVIGDAAQREQVVAVIAGAMPPVEGIARAAFQQVTAGAVPSGIAAIIGLLWGSSRFYGALDRAFSRIFQTAPQRTEIERTLRGVLVMGLFVALPIGALLVGSLASWLLDLAPNAVEIQGVARGFWQLASPLGSIVLFVGAIGIAYRFVPGERVPMAALLPPAVVSGLVLAAFTQVFTFVAPRLVGVAALYGTFVAVFAVLAWLSVGFNVLLLGASWARVRSLPRPAGPADVVDGRESVGAVAGQL